MEYFHTSGVRALNFESFLPSTVATRLIVLFHEFFHLCTDRVNEFLHYLLRHDSHKFEWVVLFPYLLAQFAYNLDWFYSLALQLFRFLLDDLDFQLLRLVIYELIGCITDATDKASLVEATLRMDVSN